MPQNIDEFGMNTKSLVDELTDALDLPVTVSCTAEGGMVVTYASKAHDQNLRNTYQKGFVFSYVSTAAGLVFIAMSQAAEREKLLESLRASTTDLKDITALSAPNLEEKLDGIRKRGYAFVWGQLNGVVSLAVPIVRDGEVLGALSVRSADTTLRERSMVEKYLSPLSNSAKAIACCLNG